MANVSDLTTAFFAIVKADRNADGTMMVYGKATDDSLDIDQQICDPVWLDRAMPDWFKTGGNIREQHSNIAAGVAKEYEKKADGHYIHALVVDPISVKKVDTGVLKGFSIGIKSPRVVKDNKAVNGRIVDGQIVEVSLVDRPANPNCQLILAKSVGGESGVWKVEELIEKAPEADPSTIIKPRKGEPADKKLYNRIKQEAKAKFDVYPSAYANAWLVREYKKRGGKYQAESKDKGLDLDEYLTEEEYLMATKTLAIPESIMADLLKFDKTEFETARNALATLVQVEAEGIKEGHDELLSIRHLLESIAHLQMWYEGEELEGEVMEEMEEVVEMSAEKSMNDKSDLVMRKGEDRKMFKERCMKADETEKEFDARCKMYKESMSKEKSTDTHKCLECGCNVVQDSHGLTTTTSADGSNNGVTNVTTAVMVSPSETPKSAEGEAAEEVADEIDAVTELPTDETKVSAEEISAEDIEAIVEKAVLSATNSVRSEVALLLSAKEAAENKATTLEGELATAKSLAVGGGPKRTLKPIDTNNNDLLTKALVYKQKANASTDPTLIKGYKALADEFFAKAEALNK